MVKPSSRTMSKLISLNLSSLENSDFLFGYLAIVLAILFAIMSKIFQYSSVVLVVLVEARYKDRNDKLALRVSTLHR